MILLEEGEVNGVISDEARENEMIALATELARKQILEGTASSQVITHFLKLGTEKERLEKERLMRENELLKAKTEALHEMKGQNELFTAAMEAMKKYTGRHGD